MPFGLIRILSLDDQRFVSRAELWRIPIHPRDRADAFTTATLLVGMLAAGFWYAYLGHPN